MQNHCFLADVKLELTLFTRRIDGTIGDSEGRICQFGLSISIASFL
jgi:hypothetical protein